MEIPEPDEAAELAVDIMLNDGAILEKLASVDDPVEPEETAEDMAEAERVPEPEAAVTPEGITVFDELKSADDVMGLDDIAEEAMAT